MTAHDILSKQGIETPQEIPQKTAPKSAKPRPIGSEGRWYLIFAAPLALPGSLLGNSTPGDGMCAA